MSHSSEIFCLVGKLRFEKMKKENFGLLLCIILLCNISILFVLHLDRGKNNNKL